MKAIVKSKAEPGLWIEEVPEPEMTINDVMIRVKKGGICGTDLHIYNWDAWAQSTIKVPTTIGHEFVGEIVDVGSNVNDFRVGDIVSAEGHLVCGRCRNCMAGRRAFEVFGEDVLITGAGPIGIMAAAVARHAGARNIVITDVNPYRLELAEKMGDVNMAVNVKEKNLKDVQKDLGMKEGFDVGFEMSGIPSAFQDMIANMFHGSRIALLGIPTEQFAIDWKTVVFNMLHIKGIYGRQMYETWYQMSVLLETGVDISPVITHRYSCRDFEKGFEAIREGNCGKVILDFEEI